MVVQNLISLVRHLYLTTRRLSFNSRIVGGLHQWKVVSKMWVWYCTDIPTNLTTGCTCRWEKKLRTGHSGSRFDDDEDDGLRRTWL